MSVGVRKSSFSLESRGTVVEHCRKYTVGRRRVSLSPCISSLVLRRWRRPSCSIRVIVIVWDSPGPPGQMRACTLEGPGARGSPGPHEGEVRGLARAC